MTSLPPAHKTTRWTTLYRFVGTAMSVAGLVLALHTLAAPDAHAEPKAVSTKQACEQGGGEYGTSGWIDSKGVFHVVETCCVPATETQARRCSKWEDGVLQAQRTPSGLDHDFADAGNALPIQQDPTLNTRGTSLSGRG